MLCLPQKLLPAAKRRQVTRNSHVSEYNPLSLYPRVVFTPSKCPILNFNYFADCNYTRTVATKWRLTGAEVTTNRLPTLLCFSWGLGTLYTFSWNKAQYMNTQATRPTQPSADTWLRVSNVQYLDFTADDQFLRIINQETASSKIRQSVSCITSKESVVANMPAQLSTDTVNFVPSTKWRLLIPPTNPTKPIPIPTLSWHVSWYNLEHSIAVEVAHVRLSLVKNHILGINS